ENYGVQVDKAIHTEALERYKKLNLAPYSGFINPKLSLVKQGEKIIDVKIEYPDNFAKQMLEYSNEFSTLPVLN
ncbi:MAG TPA: dihydrofolate reductase, partial [Bacteroidales bacterium]